MVECRRTGAAGEALGLAGSLPPKIGAPQPPPYEGTPLGIDKMTSPSSRRSGEARPSRRDPKSNSAPWPPARRSRTRRRAQLGARRGLDARLCPLPMEQ